MANKTCPVCGAQSAQDDFFCRACGYDYLTGSVPRGVDEQALKAGVDRAATSHSADETYSPVEFPPADPSRASHPGVDEPANEPPRPRRAEPDRPRRAAESQSSAADQAQPAKWVAEIWIDPEWFRAQQSPDQLPSPGQPRVIGLRTDRALIGRPSSQETNPELDCMTDSGVSRQHARLISDGSRWWVEDLGSSNGTFVGQVDKALPTEPISTRVEIGPHDRIYVGSWTRIVVRYALHQEAHL